LIFVIVSWILGFGLAIVFISNGIARFSGEQTMLQRKNRLGIDDNLYGLVAWAEVAAGTGLVLATLYGPDGSWPSVFKSFVWFPIGLASVIALIILRTLSVWLRRRVGSSLDDTIPSIILVLLCLAFLIAFCSRQILLG
jgi:uncharacterized membrane protein